MRILLARVITGRGIEPDPLHRRQGIDLSLGVPEVGFLLVPDCRVAEAVQDQDEAVVGEFDGTNGPTDEGLEGVVEAVDLVLDMGFAVVGLGKDIGDPDGDQPAVGETLVTGVWREMAVEGLGEWELDREAHEQGDIIDPFVSQFQGGTPRQALGKAGLYRRGRADDGRYKRRNVNIEMMY